MKKKLLSLFSGCGGMDIGFEGSLKVHQDCVNKVIHPDWIVRKEGEWLKLADNNFELIFANDVWKPAWSAWIPYFTKRGNSPDIFHLDSIVELVKKSKKGEFEFPQQVDIVTGGFPCQDFSTAGKRKGLESHKSHTGSFLSDEEDALSENRGTLYLWMKEVIELTSPKLFVAENVKGLTTFKQNLREKIENDFKNIGGKEYIVISAILNAANYGVPQSRERIFFIGLNKQYLKPEALKALEQKIIQNDYYPFPFPTHCHQSDISQLLKYYSSVLSVVKDLKEPELEEQDIAQIKYSRAKYLNKGQGQSEVNLYGLSPTIRAEHHGNIEYRRLSIEHGGKYIDELEGGLKERRLTVRECARIQTFPDDYEFVRESNNDFKLSASDSYKLIGNAVPPLLAYNIARRLQEIWTRLFIESNLENQDKQNSIDINNNINKKNCLSII